MQRYILLNLVALSVLFNAVVLIVSVTRMEARGQRVLVTKSERNISLASSILGKVVSERDRSGILQKVPPLPGELIKEGTLPPRLKNPSEVRPDAPGGGRGYCHIMSQHNLSLMYKGFLNFADDNDGRLPWQLTVRGVRNHIDARATAQDKFGQQTFGNSVNLVKMHPRVAAVGGSVGIRAVKAEIRMAKVLLSPCDVSRKKNNDLIDKFWNIYDTKEGRPVPHSGMSYGICFGADTQRPSTVFAASRNLTTKDLSTAKWAGEENAALGIPELKAGQGYLVLMDGSTSLSTDADLGLSGKVTRNHFRARGGVALGRSSALMALPY